MAQTGKAAVMLDSAAVRIRSPSARRFGRFLIVGVLNAAVGYGLFAGLVVLGMMPEAALLLATILGVIFNFATIGHFVFGNLDQSRILRFVGLYAAVYVLNAFALRGLISLAMPPLLAQLLLLPAAAVMTFAVLRGFVFKEKSL